VHVELDEWPRISLEVGTLFVILGKATMDRLGKSIYVILARELLARNTNVIVRPRSDDEVKSDRAIMSETENVVVPRTTSGSVAG